MSKTNLSPIYSITHVLKICERKRHFSYITVADPVVSVLPCAIGGRQRAVRSFLVLLGSRRLAVWLPLLVDLTLVV